MGLPRTARLSARARIETVRRRGRRAQGAIGRLWVLPSETESSRLAVAVPRKLGTAVSRNRLRRRLQAQFARQAKDWARPWDLHFLARDTGLGSSFAELGTAFAALLEQAGVR